MASAGPAFVVDHSGGMALVRPICELSSGGDSGAYNPLQQLSYFGIVFIITPLTIATGVAMSPSITGRFPWYLKIFGGRQPARSIHFLCMTAFTAFIIMHVLMVVLHGFGRELSLIALGQTSNPQGNITLLVGCLGLFSVFAIHVVATKASLNHPVSCRTRSEERSTEHARLCSATPLRSSTMQSAPSHRISG